MNQIDLRDRHAVITGGAQGLGFAMARRMIASGATVTLWDTDGPLLEKAVAALGPSARSVTVDVASIAGKEGNPNASAYSASKAAVIGLTKSLGKELAGLDIAVNCITPATAETRILEQLTPEFIEYMRSKIPRGRFLDVEEAAAMVAWLVSAENSFTTGAVFDLSGGRATY